DEVARHGELAAPTQGIACHRGDDRLAQRAHALPGGGAAMGKVGEEEVHEACVLELLDVGAGGKGLLAAGDDDGADAGVFLEGLERRAQLVDQRGGERVERGGAVQRHDADPPLGFDQDVLVAHDGSLDLYSGSYWMSGMRRRPGSTAASGSAGRSEARQRRARSW